MPLDLTDATSTLGQLMAWCRQTSSHYLSQCWPRSISSYSVTRLQCVELSHVFDPSDLTTINTNLVMNKFHCNSHKSSWNICVKYTIHLIKYAHGLQFVGFLCDPVDISVKSLAPGYHTIEVVPVKLSWRIRVNNSYQDIANINLKAWSKSQLNRICYNCQIYYALFGAQLVPSQDWTLSAWFSCIIKTDFCYSKISEFNRKTPCIRLFLSLVIYVVRNKEF